MPPNGRRAWCVSSCPSPPGGATDVLTRLLCQRLSTELNVPFIVENRGGAGGNVGGAAVASAPNDGYTFLMGAPGVLSYNKALYREMRFDPDRELEPVSLFARLPNVLVVNPDVPARNVAELVAYAKANPNKLNYGAIGAGATSFLSAELFKSMAGVDIQFVSYSATTLSLTDLITGRIQLVIDNLISFLPVIRDGRVRALGMSTAVRSPLLPELPTISEGGVPGYEASSWIMVAAPAGTPQTVTQSLAAAIRRIADDTGLPRTHRRTRRGARGRYARGSKGFRQGRSRQMAARHRPDRRARGLIGACVRADPES